MNDDQLSALYGPPLQRLAAVGDQQFWRHTTENRDREVCMVIRSADSRLLTFTKSFYPPGVFRLLTGGVEADETPLDALYREVAEETGLQIAVRRLLAVVRYQPEMDPDDRVWFTTYAFLVDVVGGTLHCSDPQEQVEEFRWIEPQTLSTLADQLAALPAKYSADLEERWHLWGRFRAVAVRAVREAYSSTLAP